MAPPFTDQGEAAVCARVAIALIKRARIKRDIRAAQPCIVIGCTVGELHGLRLTTIRLALLSLAVWVEGKKSTQEWLAGVLMRDYYGFSIRRCYYAEYKANRRSDPRVTNRGVTSLPMATTTNGCTKSTEKPSEAI